MGAIHHGFIHLACIIIFIFYYPSHAGTVDDTKVAIVDEMIAAFQGGCNMGTWTQSALGQAQAMTSLLEKLREKASCKGLDRSIDSLKSVQSKLVEMSENANFEGEKYWEEIMNDLIVLINNPSIDSAEKAELQSQYASARYELSQYKAKVADANTLDPDRDPARALEAVRQHLLTLVSESSNWSACYRDNPSAGLQLGASMIGMAGSFAPGLIGTGISAISALIQAGIEFGRTFPISKQIFEIRKSLMPVALRCGMEAMTRDYCRARDAKNFAQLERYDDNHQPLPFFYGVDLLERRLPILNGWLDRIINGIEPANGENAASIDKIFRGVSRANSMRRLAQGVLNEGHSDVRKARGDASKTGFVRKTLIKIIFEIFFIGGDDNPWAGFETPKSLIVKIIPGAGQPNSNEGEIDYIDRLISEGKIHPRSLVAIEHNLFDAEDGVFIARYREILNNFNEKVNIDSRSLVRAGTAPNTNNVNPAGALQRILSFLDIYSYDLDPVFREQEEHITTQLRTEVENVLRQLRRPDATDDRKPDEETDPSDPMRGLSPARQVILATHTTFKLENQNVYLPSLMRRLVVDDLSNRMCKNEAPDSIDNILRLAGEDIYQILSQNGLTPYKVTDDVDQSHSITQASLANFRKFFAQQLGWSVAHLDEQARLAGEDENGANRRTLGRLCLFILISGSEWPKDVPRSLCKGTKVVSEEAKLTLDFNEVRDRLKAKPLADQVCVYEDFLRADRLAFAMANRREENQCSQTTGTKSLQDQRVWQKIVNSL